MVLGSFNTFTLQVCLHFTSLSEGLSILRPIWPVLPHEKQNSAEIHEKLCMKNAIIIKSMYKDGLLLLRTIVAISSPQH